MFVIFSAFLRIFFSLVFATSRKSDADVTYSMESPSAAVHVDSASGAVTLRASLKAPVKVTVLATDSAGHAGNVPVTVKCGTGNNKVNGNFAAILGGDLTGTDSAATAASDSDVTGTDLSVNGDSSASSSAASFSDMSVDSPGVDLG